MDIKETLKLYRSDNILLSDSAYYKYIFKKTEKIVCTVFYILEHTDKNQKDIVASSVLESAKRTLDSVLRTLSCRWYTSYDELYTFLGTLVALESNIRVAQAVVLFQEAVADLLAFEIETVLRTLRQYLSREKGDAPDFASFSLDQTISPSTADTSRSSSKAVREHVPCIVTQEPKPSAEDAEEKSPVDGKTLAPPIPPRKRQSKGQQAERRRMIKDIIASKGQSTIKDIAEKMPDHSEKTIQREIIVLVNEGSVIKEGEKRWSRYSLIPGL